MKNPVLKTNCIIVVIFLIAGNCLGSNMIKDWSRIWGSSANNYGQCLSVDSDGNAYVAGHTIGGFDGQSNAGERDICLTKYNLTGTKQWVKIWGSATNDYSFGVSLDPSGNAYVAGCTLGGFDGEVNAGKRDICLTKYNASGTKQWTRIWGSTAADYGEDVSVDSSGNVYVAGHTNGEYDSQTNAGGYDICLTKYNASGTKQWTRIWGSAFDDYSRDVSADSSGNAYVTGYTNGEFDGQSSTGDREIFLTKYNASGTKQWTRIWGSQFDDYGNGVYVDVSGDAYVTGYTYDEFDGETNTGSLDIFLTKYNASGTKQWTRIWGSTVSDYSKSVSVDSSGNAYVAGYTFGEYDGQTNAGRMDICLTKYNTSGTKQWTKIWGSTATEYGNSVAVDSGGNYCFVAGYTAGEFDGQTNSGGYDICLNKFVNPVPLLYITNANFSVELPDTTAIIGGTNNDFIAIGNTMWWQNTSTSGVTGSFFADSSKSWTISGIELTPDANVVVVYGSNIFGNIATDSITINLVPEPTSIWIILLLFTPWMMLHLYQLNRNKS